MKETLFGDLPGLRLSASPSPMPPSMVKDPTLRSSLPPTLPAPATSKYQPQPQCRRRLPLHGHEFSLVLGNFLELPLLFSFSLACRSSSLSLKCLLGRRSSLRASPASFCSSSLPFRTLACRGCCWCRRHGTLGTRACQPCGYSFSSSLRDPTWDTRPIFSTTYIYMEPSPRTMGSYGAMTVIPLADDPSVACCRDTGSMKSNLRRL